jgi:ribosome-associated protein
MRITPTISIPDSEISLAFVRSSGPGGQNVNKLSSAVELRFDARNSPSLPPDVRQRLLALAGSRATSEGVIVLDARRHRTQPRNRADAMERLADLIRRAAVRPRRRKPTRPTPGSRQRRLESKKRHGETKKSRSNRTDD